MDLAKRVRARREELGWSQEDLAKKMGYSSRSSINKIENGRPCTQKIIYRLSKALDVSIAYLMGWEEPADYVVNNGENYLIVEINKLNLTDDQIDRVLQYAKFLSKEE